MLAPTELASVAEQFGVASQQVQRDHLLSHLLAALAAVPDVTERLVFFGGTALARTHLVHGRLSEDLDLLAMSDRGQLADDIERTLDRRTRREFGSLRWDPSLRNIGGSEAAVVHTADELSVRMQLLPGDHYPKWPTEIRDLELRYSDVPTARLRVLTLPAFVVAKTAAWAERSTPRDLYDLQALAELDAVNEEAADLYLRTGPTGALPSKQTFRRPPTETQWRSELAAQTRLTITAETALDRVRQAWAAAGGDR